jgi:general nucleoside transport system ATP-binding protein
VRPADARTAGALSGGNQQKFVLGRELDGAPDALVVENPTRGLDIRATEAVLTRLRDARDAGCAVVAYSSDLDEILGLADRMVVCYDGSLTEVPVDAERVGRAMVGIG